MEKQELARLQKAMRVLIDTADRNTGIEPLRNEIQGETMDWPEVMCAYLSVKDPKESLDEFINVSLESHAGAPHKLTLTSRQVEALLDAVETGLSIAEDTVATAGVPKDLLIYRTAQANTYAEILNILSSTGET